MKHGTSSLVKFQLLQRALGKTKQETAGILTLLWEGTGLNCPLGDIGKFQNDAIGILCHEEGDPNLFVKSLIRFRWIDFSKEHRLVIHDWPEHCPYFLRRKWKNEMDEVAKTAIQVPLGCDDSFQICDETFQVWCETFQVCDEPSTVGCKMSALSSLVQSSLVNIDSPNGESCPSAPPDGEPSGRKRVRKRKPAPTKDPLFDRFWGIYPRREGKTKALQRFTEAVKRIAQEKSISRAEAAELLIERAGVFALSPKGRSGQFCPMAQRWLYEGRWDDDPATWEIDPKDSQLTPAQRRSRSVSKVIDSYFSEKEDSSGPE